MISNSPINHNEEAFVLLHEATKLKSTYIEHIGSIMIDKSQYEYEYKFINFDLMGSDHVAWKEQLQNDLENLYINEDLQLIGGYSSLNSSTQFKYVMYKVSDQAKSSNFDTEIHILYDKLK